MSDLLVIGAGLSGMMAAIVAAQRGVRVRVIATGLGALHWTAGTIDVLGYLPHERAPVKAPFAAWEALIAQRSHHPYALAGEAGLRRSLVAFRTLTESMDLPYGGAEDPDQNVFLPSPLGAPRPVYLAPRGQLAGDMGRSDPYLIVGFHALRDFYPTVIAENLRKQGYEARAKFLPIETITSRSDFSPVTLAQALDDDVVLKQLINALESILRPGERIGLPAILGMKRHTRILAEIAQVLDAPVFEIPTLPPSVPGMRLSQALRRHLESGLRARLDLGMTVSDFKAEDHHIRWVSSLTSARPLKHGADQFLLATGGILGGGIHSDQDGRVWEVIFDLPIDIPQQRSLWFQPDFLAPHPVFMGGLRVTAAMQPVMETDVIPYRNLWAAGGALTGADPIAERSLEGIALATGVLAAEQLIEV